ncbi:MAG: tetratricopeptide repeat protein [Kofleriaceae bacterium]
MADPEVTYKRDLRTLRGTARVPALVGLADTYYTRGRLKLARRRYEEALALDADEPAAYLGVAQVMAALGEGDPAPAFERALGVLIARDGETHRSVSACLNELGTALAGDDLHAAAAAFQHAIAIDERTPGDPAGATALGNLAYCCSELGKPAAALVYAGRALALQEAALPAGHLDIAVTLSNMAHYHRETGRDDLALAVVTRLAAGAARLARKDEATAAEVVFATATLVLELTGDAGRAAKLYTTSLLARERLSGRKEDAVVNSTCNAIAHLFEAGAVDHAITIATAAEQRWSYRPFVAAITAKLAALHAGDRAGVLEATELDEE